MQRAFTLVQRHIKIYYNSYMITGENIASKYSTTLSQNVYMDRTTGTITCEDGTAYSAEEAQIIRNTGKQIPLQVHIIKKVFQGTLVK